VTGAKAARGGAEVLQQRGEAFGPQVQRWDLAWPPGVPVHVEVVEASVVGYERTLMMCRAFVSVANPLITTPQ
jgi:hypothetical protein